MPIKDGNESSYSPTARWSCNSLNHPSAESGNGPSIIHMMVSNRKRTTMTTVVTPAILYMPFHMESILSILKPQ